MRLKQSEMFRIEKKIINIVGMATYYVLDGLGIESLWGWGRARFSAPDQTAPEANFASCTMNTCHSAGVSRLGRDADHSPPYSAEVKETVKLYL